MKNYFKRMKPTGTCPSRKPVSKIIWSWIGAFLGIFLVSAIGRCLESTDTHKCPFCKNVIINDDKEKLPKKVLESDIAKPKSFDGVGRAKSHFKTLGSKD